MALSTAQFTHQLLTTLTNLTRSCCTNDQYTHWLRYFQTSDEVEQYLTRAAVAFEEEAQRFPLCDRSLACNAFAGLLLATEPLSAQQLFSAAHLCVHAGSRKRECV